jgi:DNA primase
MAGRIPQHFIDDLMTRVDIVEVIDEYVPLKKAGHEYKACCPFHDEKTPSFTVSPGKQFYHCFGCGAHGTAIGFLMDYGRMEFPEAVETLAARLGLEVPREGGDNSPRQDYSRLYACMENAAAFYRRQLREHATAPRAVNYLKGRGLDGQTAEKFTLGYAPPGWDNLMQALADKDAALRDLVEAGLVKARDDKRYDTFRNRIMFPIRDRRGRVIAFGGRTLGDDDGPKYLNSPETPIFHKGRELYGLYEARQALRELPRLLVVEGYMDVVALAQSGIPYAVATLGTATTAEHLELLYRTTPEVVFCFDGDRAGRQAAWRALENALPVIREGRQAGFMFLPEGEDPDSLVRREGKAAFEKRILDALPLSTFLLNTLADKLDLGSIDGRARLVELARPLLGRIAPGVYLDLLLDQLAGIVHMDAAQLRVHLQENAPPAASEARRRPPRPAANRTEAITPLRRAISLLLQHPELARQVTATPRFATLQRPGVKLLIELLELLHENPHLNTAALLEHWRGSDDSRHLARLANYPQGGADVDVSAEFHGVLALLDREVSEARCRELETRADLTDSEKDELKQLHREMAGLSD